MRSYNFSYSPSVSSSTKALPFLTAQIPNSPHSAHLIIVFIARNNWLAAAALAAPRVELEVKISLPHKMTVAVDVPVVGICAVRSPPTGVRKASSGRTVAVALAFQASFKLVKTLKGKTFFRMLPEVLRPSVIIVVNLLPAIIMPSLNWQPMTVKLRAGRGVPESHICGSGVAHCAAVQAALYMALSS